MESTSEKDSEKIPLPVIFSKHVDSPECWCEPELEYESPETINQVWVHREVH